MEQVFSLVDNYVPPAKNTDEIFYSGKQSDVQYNACTALITNRGVVSKVELGHSLTIDYTHVRKSLPQGFSVISAETRVVDGEVSTLIQGESAALWVSNPAVKLLFLLQIATPCGNVLMKGNSTARSGTSTHLLDAVSAESIRVSNDLTSVLESLEDRLTNLEQKIIYADTE